MLVEECDLATAMSCNRAWHSVLPEFKVYRGLKACFAGKYDGVIYAVAIWTSPAGRFIDDGATSELRRFAIDAGSPPNTASRMLAVMVRLMAKKYVQLMRVISYQATAIHKGTIYKAAGWTPGRVTLATEQRWLLRVNYDGIKRGALQACGEKVRWEKVV